jgi:hypothetical protein
MHEIRRADSMLRRWCPIACTHQDVEDATCGWNHDNHRLRVRRMLVCSECEQGYFKRADFVEHVCNSEY